MRINTLEQDISNQAYLTNSEKERNNELVAENSMTRHQLSTAQELGSNLKENLDYLKESNSDLSRILSSRNDEIIRINDDNKNLVEKINGEKQRINLQLTDIQNR